MSPAVATVNTTFPPLQKVVVPPAEMAASPDVGAGFTVTEIEFDSVPPQLLLTSHVYVPVAEAVKLCSVAPEIVDPPFFH